MNEPIANINATNNSNVFQVNIGKDVKKIASTTSGFDAAMLD